MITGGGKDSRIVKFDTLYRKTGLEAALPDHLGSIRTVSQVLTAQLIVLVFSLLIPLSLTSLLQGKGSQLLVGTTRNSILTGNFDLNFQEIMVGHVSDVPALAASPSQPQFISAGHDRQLHLWDILTRQVVWSNDVGEQAQSACFSPDGEVIVVGTVTGKWVVLSAATREVYGVHQDGEQPVHTAKFSPDGAALALGSRDNAIYIYSVREGYRKFSRAGRCLGHSTAVTQLDWTTDSQHIQSNSGAELLYWNATTCRSVRDIDTIREFEWASGDCVVSWSSLGCWGEGPDTPDPTAVSRCKVLYCTVYHTYCTVMQGRDLVAAGDTAGRVKLYPGPVCQVRALHHSYPGHSSAVTAVRWSADTNTLLSVGGRDTAVLQWSLVQ